MKYLIPLALILFVSYGFVGTSGNVDEIKRLAPSVIKERGWEIVRYEGYQYGSFGRHGGKVWYHVKDKAHSNTYYRVFITLWDDELHFVYGSPEVLQRINLDKE